MKSRMRTACTSLMRAQLFSIVIVGLNSCINLSEGRTEVVRYEIQVTNGGAPLAKTRVRICNREDGKVPDLASDTSGYQEFITTQNGVCRFELEIPVHTAWTHFGATGTGGFGGLRVRIESEGYATKEFDVPVRSFVKQGNDFHRVEAIEMSK